MIWLKLVIHYLLFAIAPFALVAYAVALNAPTDQVAIAQNAKSTPFARSCWKATTEWQNWDGRLRLLGLLVLFASGVSVLVGLFIPIDAYLSGANYQMVILLGVFGAIPAAFGYPLGRLADSCDKPRLIAVCLFGISTVTLGIVIFPDYWFKLLAVFFVGVILELLAILKTTLITTLGPASTYGVRGSSFEFIVTVGDLVAPIVLGLGLDVIGLPAVSVITATTAMVIGGTYLFGQAISNERGHNPSELA